MIENRKNECTMGEYPIDKYDGLKTWGLNILIAASVATFIGIIADSGYRANESGRKNFGSFEECFQSRVDKNQRVYSPHNLSAMISCPVAEVRSWFR